MYEIINFQLGYEFISRDKAQQWHIQMNFWDFDPAIVNTGRNLTISNSSNSTYCA